jgi:hypothetical protein
MNIVDIIKEALRIGRTHKSLWLFGFLVGLGAPGTGGGGPGGGGAPAEAVAAEPGRIVLIVLVGGLLVLGFVILKFVSTGALIEGVKRARENRSLTVREGFREGWAHWGVLFRIAVLYFAINAVSVALLVGLTLLAGRLLGPAGAGVVGILAVIAGVPWLVTTYIWQAFAERIAVLENRRAVDAMRKARLFLHGRLQHGLKIAVAGFLGVVAIGAVGVVVALPVGGLLAGATLLWGVFPSVALGILTLLPVAFVIVAFIGIMTSSVWTIGYLTQVQQ